MAYAIGCEYIDDDGCENMDNVCHMTLSLDDAIEIEQSIASCDHVFKTFITHCSMDDYNHWYSTGYVDGWK